MNLKQAELNAQLLIQASRFTSPLQTMNDSTEAAVSVEAEEAPALENLKNEVDEPYDVSLKVNCEEAIASYLNRLEQELVSLEDEEKSQHAVERLADLQERVVSALEKHARYQGHDVHLIEECRKACTCCYVIPTYIAEKIYQIDRIRESCLDASEAAIENEAEAIEIKKAAPYFAVGQEPLITIYTTQNDTDLPGKLIASNKGKGSAKMDATAQKALDGAKDVHQFWLKAYGLSSYDGKGSEIRSTVHYDVDYGNAFWNGEQMVYGDGDDIITNLTELSIIAHEFGHAVTGDKLNYEGESGALNEHLSDVWGSLVLQFKKGQTVDQASWLIGEGAIKLGNKSYPLRSMKAPGTAYNSALIGKDPQPDHYTKRYIGDEDDGGVHINSGIPNKAFYLFAKAQGGQAWQKAGKLWYLTLKTDNLIKPNCTMAEFAHATLTTAIKNFPADYKMHQDLINAWKAVGLA